MHPPSIHDSDYSSVSRRNEQYSSNSTIGLEGEHSCTIAVCQYLGMHMFDMKLCYDGLFVLLSISSQLGSGSVSENYLPFAGWTLCGRLWWHMWEFDCTLYCVRVCSALTIMSIPGILDFYCLRHVSVFSHQNKIHMTHRTNRDRPVFLVAPGNWLKKGRLSWILWSEHALKNVQLGKCTWSV